MIDCTNEGSNICVILQPVRFEDGINALLPGSDAFWSHPETKKICFFDKPFTFEWITFHIICVETGKN